MSLSKVAILRHLRFEITGPGCLASGRGWTIAPGGEGCAKRTLIFIAAADKYRARRSRTSIKGFVTLTEGGRPATNAAPINPALSADLTVPSRDHSIASINSAGIDLGSPPLLLCDAFA